MCLGGSERRIEGVGYDLDSENPAATGHQYCRHVEPARTVPQPPFMNERAGQTSEPALLAWMDGVKRPAERITGARLHLDEDEVQTMRCDEVDLPVPGAYISVEDDVTAGGQRRGDGIFAGTAQRPAVHSGDVHLRMNPRHAALRSSAHNGGEVRGRVSGAGVQSSVSGCCL